ncbi:MAG: glycosyltransferase, partial [Elusimicrobiota bacterium]
MKNFISIVIPAYNEENRIGKTLEKIIEFLSGKPYSYDIIVVDDGSSDSTSSVVESVKNVQLSNSNLRLMKNEVNKGKGASVKKGVLSCESDYVYFTD